MQMGRKNAPRRSQSFADEARHDAQIRVRTLVRIGDQRLDIYRFLVECGIHIHNDRPLRCRHACELEYRHQPQPICPGEWTYCCRWPGGSPHGQNHNPTQQLEIVRNCLLDTIPPLNCLFFS